MLLTLQFPVAYFSACQFATIPFRVWKTQIWKSFRETNRKSQRLSGFVKMGENKEINPFTCKDMWSLTFFDKWTSLNLSPKRVFCLKRVNHLHMLWPSHCFRVYQQLQFIYCCVCFILHFSYLFWNFTTQWRNDMDFKHSCMSLC